MVYGFFLLFVAFLNQAQKSQFVTTFSDVLAQIWHRIMVLVLLHDALFFFLLPKMASNAPLLITLCRGYPTSFSHIGNAES
jgi:hypothetical protein